MTYNNTICFKIPFNIEIFIRDKNKVNSKLIHFRDIKKLRNSLKKTINKDLKKITSKRKNFLKNINFSNPSIMGVLNLTPDSFSDGGKFNKTNKSFKHISSMIQSGAEIVDVGGESTRPGSKTIDPATEWKRVKHVLKNSLIPLVTGFPMAFLAMFFTGSLLLEQIFTLDGLGLLSYQAVIQRDYPIVLGTLFIFSLMALIGQLLTDLSYVLIDPRISFDESRD